MAFIWASLWMLKSKDHVNRKWKCKVLRHDDVIKHFPRYWPFVRGIPRSHPVNSPHKGQWSGALMFSLISARINGGVNDREAGSLRRIRPHYDVTVMDIEWGIKIYSLRKCTWKATILDTSMKTSLTFNYSRCRYYGMIYGMILYASLQWLRQHIHQSLNPQRTPHSSPAFPWFTPRWWCFIRLTSQII